MSATARRISSEPPALVLVDSAYDGNREDSEEELWKKRRSFDLSRSINYIIHNEKFHDFAIGAGIGLAGMGAKMAFKAVAHATGFSGFVILGAAAVGFGKAWHKAAKNNWYKDDETKDWRVELLRSTLLSGGGAAAAMLLPVVGDVFEKLTEHFNFGNMFAGLGHFFNFGKPEIPQLPSTPIPQAPIPHDIIDAPLPEADAIPEIPVSVPAISEHWQHIEALAESGDPQAKKDLAMSLLNGSHGFEVDTDRAMALYRQAAEAGNIQAKVDLAYIEFHGLAGVEADHEAAITAMKELATQNATAAHLLAEWAPKPEIASVIEAAASQDLTDLAGAPDIAGQSLSMTFTVADNGLDGVLHDALDIPAGTVFDVPVSQINLSVN